MTQISFHFTRGEFACKCGCGFDTVDVRLIGYLENIRDHFKQPIKINSGCRCPTYNAAVGGEPKSQHMLGRAADIVVQGVLPSVVAEYAEAMGFDGVGRYDTSHTSIPEPMARHAGTGHNMGLLARIFDTPAAITHTIDTVAGGLDKLIYTKQEQAEAADLQITAARGMVIEWMKATSGQNLARRWLTMVITSVWLSLYVGAAIFATVAVFVEDEKRSNRILAAAGILAGYANELANVVMVIIMFYFAAPYMGQAIDILLQRIGLRAPIPSSQPRTPPQG